MITVRDFKPEDLEQITDVSTSPLDMPLGEQGRRLSQTGESFTVCEDDHPVACMGRAKMVVWARVSSSISVAGLRSIKREVNKRKYNGVVIARSDGPKSWKWLRWLGFTPMDDHSELYARSFNYG